MFHDEYSRLRTFLIELCTPRLRREGVQKNSACLTHGS
jgi:hypothetical protein